MSRTKIVDVQHALLMNDRIVSLSYFIIIVHYYYYIHNDNNNYKLYKRGKCNTRFLFWTLIATLLG